jgi:pimeloyl-ACP methyl ester carboxylesterase
MAKGNRVLLRVGVRIGWVALFFATTTIMAQPLLLVEDAPLQVTIRGRGFSFEALVVKPAGATGRLPVAIITHGSPRDAADRATYRARALLPQARDVAHRGWLTVVFLRRGFGQSQGPFAEGFACAAPDYRRALAAAADDIEAVRIAVAKRPDADPSRMLGIGVSAGAASMLAWAATRPDGLVGVVNLSGGTGALTPGRNCDANALISAFAAYGSQSNVPSLWLYARNDSYFGPALVQRLHGAFTQGGGKATLEMFDTVGADGHQLTSLHAGRVLWLPALDKFLRAHALPTWETPPFDDMAKQLKPEARRVLASYLNAPTEKALSISRGAGIARFWSGVGELQVARKKSLELCERDSAERCDARFNNFAVVAVP